MLLITCKQSMLTIKNALIASMFALSICCQAEVVVIIHPDNENDKLDKTTIKQIFMGKIKEFPNGEKSIPIEIASGTIRAEFLKKYLGKRDAEVQSYWSRQLFTGKGTPPKGYDEEIDVKKLVASNPNVIGFIERSHVDDSVKVVEIP